MLSMLSLEYWYSSTWFMVACFIALFYYYSVSTFDYWKRRGVPYLRPVPLFGNIYKNIFMLTSKYEDYQQMYHAFEGHKVAGIFSMRTPVLMLRDPEVIKQMLVKDFVYLQDRECIFNREADIFADNLFALGGARWRYLRAKLTPAFTSSKMRSMMFPHLLACAEELKNFLEGPATKGDIIEIKDLISRFTVNAIGCCAFGIKCNCFKNKESVFQKLGTKMFHISIPSVIVHAIRLSSPKLFNLLKLKVIPDDVTDFFLALVKDTIGSRLKEGERTQALDFIDILIQLQNQNAITKEKGEEEEVDAPINDQSNSAQEHMEFTDNLLAAQAFLFFLAGFDTSSTLLSMCLLELALNPEVQQRLQQEVDTELEKNNGKLTYDLVQGLTYMDMVFSETLRMYPPGNDLKRIVTKPYKVPGSDIQLNVGDMVLVPVFSLHRDPLYFSDPERFDPEHFSETSKASRPAFSFLPFGEGPRNCIGKRFGLLKVKLGLAVLMSNFQFNISRKTSLPIVLDKSNFLTTTRGEIYLRITKRKPTN